MAGWRVWGGAVSLLVLAVAVGAATQSVPLSAQTLCDAVHVDHSSRVPHQSTTEATERLTLRIRTAAAPHDIGVCVSNANGPLRQGFLPVEKETLHVLHFEVPPEQLSISLVQAPGTNRWSTQVDASACKDSVLLLEIVEEYENADNWGFASRDPGCARTSGFEALAASDLEPRASWPGWWWVWILIAGGMFTGVTAAAWPALRVALHGAGAFFTRIVGHAALTHPIRRRIVQVVAEEPGMSMADLGRVLGSSGGNLRYHVQVLLDRRLLVEERMGAQRCLFPTHLGGADRTELLGRPTESMQRFIQVLQNGAPLTIRELAKEVGVSASCASKVASRLCARGIASKTRRGRYVVVELLPGTT